MTISQVTPDFLSFSTCFKRKPLGITNTGYFTGFSITQLTVSKHGITTSKSVVEISHR